MTTSGSSTAAPAPLPLTSRWLLAALDRRRHADYLVLAAIAGLPSVIAWQIGAHATFEHDGQTYLGFLDKPNLWPQVVLLPLLLFAVRWVFGRIADVSAPTLPDAPPPLIRLFPAGPQRARAYEHFRARMSSPRLVALILGVVICLKVLEASSDIATFVTGEVAAGAQRDWSMMYLTGEVDRGASVALWLCTELVQFLLYTIRFIAIFGVGTHNLFLLAHVWQRRRARADPERPLIPVDLDDPERCLGMRHASEAFNLPVLLAIIGGSGILLSRFSNLIGQGSLQWADFAGWPPEFDRLGAFPDTGQWILAVAWIVSIVVISLPIAIRFLPCVGPRGMDISATDYLREFLSDAQGAPSPNASAPIVDALARRFAQHALWPAGDNRARLLFLFAFMVLLVVLYPLRPGDGTIFLAATALMVAIAWALERASFGVARRLLAYVDERLVGSGPIALRAQADEVPTQIDRSVFLSYRRADSRAHTRLVLDRLLRAMRPEQVFMDVASLRDGEDFVAALDRAVHASDVVLVIIGPRWLDSRDAQGRRRLEDPGDYVRREVALALERTPLVIPVVVGGASMPTAAQLPAALRGLAECGVHELDDGHWDADCDRLLDVIAASERR